MMIFLNFFCSKSMSITCSNWFYSSLVIKIKYFTTILPLFTYFHSLPFPVYPIPLNYRAANNLAWIFLSGPPHCTGYLWRLTSIHNLLYRLKIHALYLLLWCNMLHYCICTIWEEIQFIIVLLLLLMVHIIK